jgi:hypothetical protein
MGRIEMEGNSGIILTSGIGFWYNLICLGMLFMVCQEFVMRRLFPILTMAVYLSTPALSNRMVLDNVPNYTWWYGCTPTAAGSMIAYWASQPGYENLYKKGDPQNWNGNGTEGTRRMVASQSYINGNINSHDCLASFLQTDNSGSTWNYNINPGLKAFVEWDDTSSYDMKDDFTAIVDPFLPGQGSIDVIKSEIDAGRPVLLTVASRNLAHSVLAYGYDDDITFQLWNANLFQSVTYPAFAVMDTWGAGSGTKSEWYDWDGSHETVRQEIFDSQGYV